MMGDSAIDSFFLSQKFGKYEARSISNSTAYGLSGETGNKPALNLAQFGLLLQAFFFVYLS